MVRRLEEYMTERFLYQSSFWWIRARLRKIMFLARKAGFASRKKIGGLQVHIRIIWSLFLSVLAYIGAFAVALAILLIAGSYGEFIDPQNRVTYDGLLTAVAAIVGVFLTLYLTSSNAVVGTIYARMPKDVRELFARERVADTYVRFLVFLTILCLGLLVVGVTRDYRPVIILYIVAVLGSVAILAFLHLGRRAFLFFDPTYLSDILFSEFHQRSRDSSIDGHQWDEPAFQDYYRRLAQRSLNGLEALVHVAREDPNLGGKSLSSLLAKIPILLSAYQKVKTRIPPSSLWYEQVPSHKEWYLTAHHAVQLATITQTGLLPEMKADQDWVEKRLLRLLVSSLKCSLRNGRIDVAIGILEDLNSAFQSLGEAWKIDYSFGVLEDTTKIVLSRIRELEEAPARDADAKQRLALIEYLGLLPISLLLGFYQSAREMHVERIIQSIGRVDWQNPDAVFRMGLPMAALQRLEFVRERVSFEASVEGKVVSPPWYIAHLLIQPIAQALEQQLRWLEKFAKEHYLRVTQQLLADGRQLYAATFLARSLEYHSKFFGHMASAQRLAESLESGRSLIELPWPTWDWKAIELELKETQKASFVCLAKCIPGLSRMVHTEELPDYLGRAVHNSGEQCYEALRLNDCDLFSELFPYYLQGILIVHAKLSEKTGEWQPDSAIVAVSGPLLDLIELSGYAKLYSELHGNPRLWEACKSEWERYLSGVDAAHVLTYLGALISYNRSLFAITPRSLMRTSWKIKFEGSLRELPRRSLHDQGDDLVGIAWRDRTIVEHDSELIQVMAGTSVDYSTLYSGTDVFIEFFLKNRSEGKDVDYGTGNRLSDAIQRWRSSRKRREAEG